MFAPDRRSLVSKGRSSGFIFASLLLVSALLGGCASENPSNGRDKGEEKPLPEIVASVIPVQLRSWPTIVRSQGSLSADEQTIIGAKVAGRIAKVHFELGEYVEEGTPLVTLDQDEFLLEIAQAESQLKQSRAAVGLMPGDPVEKLDPLNAPPVRQERALWEESRQRLQRLEGLELENAVSSSELEQAAADERVAEARYASALNGVREKIALIGLREAELGLARQRHKDAVITAPMSGFIRQRQVAVGTFLSVGQSVGTLVRTSPLRFRGSVPEKYAQMLQPMQQVRLKVESLDEPFQTTVARVSPTLDPASRALAFEASVDNSDLKLRAGLFAEAEVVVAPDAMSVVIPETALAEFAGARKVWKVVDGVLQEQSVLIGDRREGQVRITEGISPGDLVLEDASQGMVARIQSSGK